MGLGNCSGCSTEHNAPFGSRCKYVKAAKKKVAELGLSEDLYEDYLDFSLEFDADDNNKNEEPKDSDKVPPRGIPYGPETALLKDLVRISMEQKASIDLLVQNLGSLTMGVQARTPPVTSNPFLVTSAQGPTVMLPVTPVTSKQGLYNLGGAVAGNGGITTNPSPSHTNTATTTTLFSSWGMGLPPSVMSPTISAPSTQPSHIFMGNTLIGNPGATSSYMPVSHTGNPRVQQTVSGPRLNIGTGMAAITWSQPMPGSAAQVYGQPLTSSLGMVPDTTDVNTGIYLRPEFNVQPKDSNTSVKSLNYKSMNYYDLIYGMTCVSKYVLQTGGDINGYLNHMCFVARQAQLDSFTDLTFVNYDRSVIDGDCGGDTHVPSWLSFSSVTTFPLS